MRKTWGTLSTEKEKNEKFIVEISDPLKRFFFYTTKSRGRDNLEKRIWWINTEELATRKTNSES